MMDPVYYALQIKAIWSIPSVLSRIDLMALLEEARQVGSDADIELIKRLVVANIKAVKVTEPRDS